MNDSTFNIDQIGKLREIERARMKRGEPGLRSEIQALIMRLQSGGAFPRSNDLRTVQAKRLWDKGFGRETGFNSFDAYLATIPKAPEANDPDDRFPILVLVDARPGVVKACELAGVGYDETQGTYGDFPDRTKTDKVYWIHCQEGRRYGGKSIRACRREFVEDEVGLTIHEGLALFVQHPEVFRERAVDLIASHKGGVHELTANLQWVSIEPSISWNEIDEATQLCRVASRRTH